MKVEKSELNLIIQIKQFYKWLEKNSLTATEISLWHALLHIANEAGYPAWLSIPISRLSKYTGMKKDALYSARDSLETKGLIEIKTGRGNQAAQYRIIPFIDNYYQEDEDLYIENDIPGIEDENNDIPDATPQETPPKEPKKEETREINIFRKIQTLIPMPSPTDIQDIKDYLDEGMEDKLLCESIRLSKEKLPDKKPMDKWKYSKGIMRTWYNNGIKTFEEYQKHEKEREAQIKNGGNKQHNNHVRSESQPGPKTNGMREFRIPE